MRGGSLRSRRRVSSAIARSPSLMPSSPIAPTCGMRLNAMRCGSTAGGGGSWNESMARISDSSWSTACCPAPETASHVITNARSTPAAAWMGARTSESCTASGDGTATSPGTPSAAISLAFRSATTSGTSGSARNAGERSTTGQRAAAARGVHVLATSAVAAKKARCMSWNAPSRSAPTRASSPRKSISLPALRSEASSRSSPRSRSLSSSTWTRARPTAPVAPTTATLTAPPGITPSLRLEVTLGREQLGGQHRPTRRAADRVVREAHEPVVEERVGPQAPDRDALPVARVAIELRLRAGVVLEVGQERLRRAREAELLRLPFEGTPALEDLLARRLPVERGEDGGEVPVRDRHSDALRGDHLLRRGDDLAVQDGAPDLERLLLALLLLALDERDDVVDHLGPALERLPRARDGLVGGDGDPLRTEAHERVERRDVALDRAVRLHRDEAAARPEPTALRLDDHRVARVDLRDHHRDVGRPAVRGVVRDHRRLRAGVVLLELRR